MNEFKQFNLNFSSINVNSLNVSTLGKKNSKTLIKIEGITHKCSDVIFLSDIRLKNRSREVEKIFRLANGGYNIFFNSSQEKRGVAIAIRREIKCEILQTIKDNNNENF
jgi:exonuclease III